VRVAITAVSAPASASDPRVTSPLELKVRNMYRICDLMGADEGRAWSER
jgi:hypothetical protein